VSAALHSALSIVTVTDVFTSPHIALTAITTGVLAAAIAAWWISGRQRVIHVVAVAFVTAAAVYLWRRSADMPQLNSDDLAGYSANDWLAPVITFIALTVYTSPCTGTCDSSLTPDATTRPER